MKFLVKLPSFRCVLLLPLLFAGTISVAQEPGGIQTGNYAGALDMYSNPAKMAGSRYRFSLILPFIVQTDVQNNQASYGLKDLTRAFKPDSIFSDLTHNPGTLSASGLLQLYLPTLMYRLTEKHSIAIGARSRALGNITNFDNKLANQLLNDQVGSNDLPYQLDLTGDQRLAIHGWNEIAGSYAGVLVDQGEHLLKAGINLKYLGGAANRGIGVQNLKATLDANSQVGDAWLTNASGRLDITTGGSDNLKGLLEKPLRTLTTFKGSGFGVDLGLIYAWQPGKAESAGSGWNDDENPYALRVGLALTDLGSINYQKDIHRSGGYDLHIAANQRFYLSEIQSIDSIRSVVDKHPEFFTPLANHAATSYHVALPATLSADADVHLHRGFFINLQGRINLANRNKTVNAGYPSTIALTPRWENRHFGVYVPLSYNDIGRTRAGLSLRLGPVIAGSYSILSNTLGKTGQADVFFGVIAGFPHPKK